LQAGYRSKSKAQPTYGCMWLHCLFHFPHAMWPSCFNFFSFLSLLCIPSPVSLSEHSLFLFRPPFPATVLLAYDNSKTKKR
jgi:hypothetical protein